MSSSYVPPHLRSSPAITVPTTSPSVFNKNATLKPSFETLDNRFKSERKQLASSLSRNLRANRGAPLEPVFVQWQPSERFQALTKEQVEEVRQQLKVDVTVISASRNTFAPIESFNDINLHPSIMKEIEFHEYTRPTPIQAQALLVALSGKHILGCAETGIRKTVSFAIPMIHQCLAQPPVCRDDGPLALILAPTRELAQQIEKEVKEFRRPLDAFKTAIAVGGTNMDKQRSELRVGV